MMSLSVGVRVAQCPVVAPSILCKDRILILFKGGNVSIYVLEAPDDCLMNRFLNHLRLSVDEDPSSFADRVGRNAGRFEPDPPRFLTLAQRLPEQAGDLVASLANMH